MSTATAMSDASVFWTVRVSSTLPRAIRLFSSALRRLSRKVQFRGIRELYSKYRALTLRISTVISRPPHTALARP